MWPASGENSYLEDVFGILRFRKRSLVSFRRFVILKLLPPQGANGLPETEACTQPMRVVQS